MNQKITLLPKYQLDKLDISDIDIAADASIQTSKLAEGNEFLKRDCSVVLINHFNAGGYRLTNVAPSLNPNDVIIRSEFDALSAIVLGLENNGNIDQLNVSGGGHFTGNLSVDGTAIIGTSLSVPLLQVGYGGIVSNGDLKIAADCLVGVPGLATLFANSTYGWDITSLLSTVFNSLDPAGTPIAIKGSAAQTGNLTEWQDSNGTVLSKIDPQGNITAPNLHVANWNTAYGWGNHALAGYLTSFSETDPVFAASAASNINTLLISQWNTAFGWGNHNIAGYALAANETLAAVTARGASTNLPIAANSFISTAGTSNTGVVHYELRTTGPRWAFVLEETELGVNAGSCFSFWRYDDSGNYLGNPFNIDRQTGIVNFETSPYVGTNKIWTAADFSSVNINNWNMAYGWGNHSAAGYAPLSLVYTQLQLQTAGASQVHWSNISNAPSWISSDYPTLDQVTSSGASSSRPVSINGGTLGQALWLGSNNAISTYLTIANANATGYLNLWNDVTATDGWTLKNTSAGLSLYNNTHATTPFIINSIGRTLIGNGLDDNNLDILQVGGSAYISGQLKSPLDIVARGGYVGIGLSFGKYGIFGNSDNWTWPGSIPSMWISASNTVPSNSASIGVFTTSSGGDVQIFPGQFGANNGHVKITTNNGVMADFDSLNGTLLKSNSITGVTLITKCIASQTADLMQWQDSGANVRAKIDVSGNFSTAALFNPASGAIDNKCISINPTINQTGTASGNTWGIQINPSHTSVLGTWKSIEDLSNKGWSYYQSGALAKNYFAGNVLLGTTVDNGSLLQVNGSSSFNGPVSLALTSDGSKKITVNCDSSVNVNLQQEGGDYDVYQSYGIGSTIYASIGWNHNYQRLFLGANVKARANRLRSTVSTMPYMVMAFEYDNGINFYTKTSPVVDTDYDIAANSRLCIAPAGHIMMGTLTALGGPNNTPATVTIGDMTSGDGKDNLVVVGTINVRSTGFGGQLNLYLGTQYSKITMNGGSNGLLIDNVSGGSIQLRSAGTTALAVAGGTKNIIIGNGIVDNSIDKLQITGDTHINGNLDSKGLALGIASRSANYTITSTDYTVLVDTTAGDVTITLPTVNIKIGQVFVIKKKAGSNNVIISGNVDGSTSLMLTTLNQAVRIQWDGLVYYTI